MSKFNLMENLADHSLKRQANDGVRTWLPKIRKLNGKIHVLLPGQ